MDKYGLIGRTLGHSFSKRYFDEKFEREGLSDASYELFELDSLENLRAWVADRDLRGFNVTVPYKEAVVEQLDELDDVAREIGAVNVVSRLGGCEGVLRGCNTDAQAFVESLKPLLQPWHSSALILGTGGAAKAVAYGLRGLGIDYRFVSRTGRDSRTLGYSDAVEASRNTFLIVNATPVGMFPNEALTPWVDVRTLSSSHLCYDLVYNPEDTRFLLEAELAGAATKNGMEMLVRQAELSWKVWNGTN